MNLTQDYCFNTFFSQLNKNYLQVYSLHVCLCLVSVWTPVASIIVLALSSLQKRPPRAPNAQRSQRFVLSQCCLGLASGGSTQPWEGQQILLYHLFRRVIMWNYLFALWSLTLMKMSLGPHRLTMLFAHSLMWNCLSASCKNTLHKQTRCSNPWRLYVQLFIWFYILCRSIMVIVIIAIIIVIVFSLTCNSMLFVYMHVAWSIVYTKHKVVVYPRFKS